MQLFTGSYTQFVGEGLEGHGDGIQLLNFNEADGSLQLIATAKNINTAYLSLNHAKQLLYSFQEVSRDKGPRLLTYRIGNNEITLVEEQCIAGGLPCYLEYIEANNRVLVACYETGNVLNFALAPDGLPLPDPQIIQHHGTSVNPTRQEGPHAHMATRNTHDGLVYVPDLGLDKILVYAFDADNRLQLHDEIDVPAGGGPRHICFHPSNEYAFVINELTGDVSLLEKSDRSFRVVANLSAMPANHRGVASSSAIKISPDGRFIYAGDRANNTVGILQFDAQEPKLTHIANQPTSGLTPRDFELSPCGKWLLLANQDSDTIEVFDVDPTNGLLRKRHSYENMKSIVCFKF